MLPPRPETACPGPPPLGAGGEPAGGRQQQDFDNNKLNTSEPEPVPVEIPVNERGWGSPVPRRRLIKFFLGKD